MVLILHLQFFQNFQQIFYLAVQSCLSLFILSRLLAKFKLTDYDLTHETNANNINDIQMKTMASILLSLVFCNCILGGHKKTTATYTSRSG